MGDSNSNTWNFSSNLELDKPRPTLLVPVIFCSLVTHATSHLCAYGSSALTLVEYSPIPHIPWYLNPSCHWEPSTATKIELLTTNFSHKMNICKFIPNLLVPHLGLQGYTTLLAQLFYTVQHTLHAMCSHPDCTAILTPKMGTHVTKAYTLLPTSKINTFFNTITRTHIISSPHKPTMYGMCIQHDYNSSQLTK